MKRIGRVATILAVGLTGSTAVFGITPDPNNPYASIAERNVFSLREPPPPASAEPPPTPPQKITLLGIVSAFGRKEVIFKTMASAKPGEAPKETTFSCGVGDREGEIDIVDIDHVTGTVKLKNHNVEQTLTLEKDGMKPTAGAAPAGLPAIPGVIPKAPPVPGARIPTAPAAGVTVPTASFGAGTTTFGGAASVRRELRVPTTSSGYSGGAGTYSATPGVTAGGISLNAGGTTPSTSSGLPNHMINWPPENSTLTPEEEVVSHLVQNPVLTNAGFPPLPPPPPNFTR